MESLKWCGVFSAECKDANGKVRWNEEIHNALFNEGEFLFLDVVLRNGTAPANWYLGLMSNDLVSIPAETSTLASLDGAGPYELTEGNCPGYGRGLITRSSNIGGWNVLTLSGGDYQATSVVAFGAEGNWTKNVRWFFLTTNGTTGDTTGKLVSMAQLSNDRTLFDGDTLTINYSIKLQ